ncbi:MAG: hypothetical protein J7K87_01415 [Candidatus Aenigmarchaeota archaeon]|nr:hypothetical protein [Candidatus Aenigmarchaeota archaeon]
MKKMKNVGSGLILLGVILLFFNTFLSFTTQHTDIGNFIVSSVEKPGLTDNMNILIFASAASWIVPLFLVFLGIITIRMHVEE